ncbi:MAG: hypothetical protein ACYDEV_07270 [Acidiferrobacter sp.]
MSRKVPDSEQSIHAREVGGPARPLVLYRGVIAQLSHIPQHEHLLAARLREDGQRRIQRG